MSDDSNDGPKVNDKRIKHDNTPIPIDRKQRRKLARDQINKANAMAIKMDILEHNNKMLAVFFDQMAGIVGVRKPETSRDIVPCMKHMLKVMAKTMDHIRDNKIVICVEEEQDSTTH